MKSMKKLKTHSKSLSAGYDFLLPTVIFYATLTTYQIVGIPGSSGHSRIKYNLWQTLPQDLKNSKAYRDQREKWVKGRTCLVNMSNYVVFPWTNYTLHFSWNRRWCWHDMAFVTPKLGQSRREIVPVLKEQKQQQKPDYAGIVMGNCFQPQC